VWTGDGNCDSPPVWRVEFSDGGPSSNPMCYRHANRVIVRQNNSRNGVTASLLAIPRGGDM
jgi:hypothetical protein